MIASTTEKQMKTCPPCTHNCNQGRACGKITYHRWFILALFFVFFAMFCVIAKADVLEDVAKEIATSPETFAVCKTVDIASTAYLLGRGFTEANPIVAWSLKVGGYMPLILVSVGLYMWLKKLDSPQTTAAVNVVTCGVAAHNLLLIP